MVSPWFLIYGGLQMSSNVKNQWNSHARSRRTFVSSSSFVAASLVSNQLANAVDGAARQVLKIDVLEKPSDQTACLIKSRRNDLLEFNYEARVGDQNGRIYDASEIRGTGQPYAYVLGSGDLIPGVDQGLYDMCIGEVRALTIPPLLGYGSRGVNLYEIPPYTNLYWTVELVSINFVRKGDSRTREDIENGY